MRIGNYSFRVQIRSATLTQSNTGEPSRTWATDDEVWASYDSLSGTELVEAQAMAKDATYQVKMRFRTGVTTAKRLIVLDNREGSTTTLNILHVRDVESAGVELELLCKEDR